MVLSRLFPPGTIRQTYPILCRRRQGGEDGIPRRGIHGLGSTHIFIVLKTTEPPKIRRLRVQHMEKQVSCGS